MPVHIDRVVKIATDAIKRVRGYGLVMASDAFQRGFAHGICGHTQGAPWFRGGDVYQLGVKVGADMRAEWTTKEGAE